MNNIRVLFICYGNICRSPMAMFILRDLAKKRGLNIEIDSAATSREELGNDMYYLAKDILKTKGIAFSKHVARVVTRKDLADYDYIFCMEKRNKDDLEYLFGKDLVAKVKLLHSQDIIDPWYSRNFELAFSRIYNGCLNFLEKL